MGVEQVDREPVMALLVGRDPAPLVRELAVDRLSRAAGCALVRAADLAHLNGACLLVSGTASATEKAPSLTSSESALAGLPRARLMRGSIIEVQRGGSSSWNSGLPMTVSTSPAPHSPCDLVQTCLVSKPQPVRLVSPFWISSAVQSRAPAPRHTEAASVYVMSSCAHTFERHQR